MEDDEFETSQRDTLVTEYLEAHGIFSFEEAPDELIDAAHAEADKTLGTNNDNKVTSQLDSDFCSAEGRCRSALLAPPHFSGDIPHLAPAGSVVIREDGAPEPR